MSIPTLDWSQMIEAARVLVASGWTQPVDGVAWWKHPHHNRVYGGIANAYWAHLREVQP